MGVGVGVGVGLLSVTDPVPLSVPVPVPESVLQVDPGFKPMGMMAQMFEPSVSSNLLSTLTKILL